METTDFSYCCGAQEITGFHGNAREVKARLRDLLAQHQTDVKSYKIDPDAFDYAPTGAYVATTIASQRGAVAALKAFKFRKVFAFTNPGTGSKVTLWAKKLVR